jgi:excisionase family DNA binding protein
MQPQIIVSGIPFDQFQETIKGIVKTEVEQIISHLPQPILTPELITRKETAQILGISLPTLNVWTKTGIIPAQRIGTRVRYQRINVYAALQDIQTLKYKRG